MDLLIKVGNRLDPLNPKFNTEWRDGQIVDIRNTGFFDPIAGPHKNFVVLKTPLDYFDLKGSTNYDVSPPSKFYTDIKKFISPMDADGKHPWETGKPVPDDKQPLRRRDYFIDWKWLMDQKVITKDTFESIYDKSRRHNYIYIDRELPFYVFHEDEKTRLPHDYSDMLGSISSGTYDIGAGETYTNITGFEADIAATLTGALIGQVKAEEVTESAAINFSYDGAGYGLTLKAKSGAKHIGGAYSTSYASVNLSTAWDRLNFNNSNIDDVTIEDLQFSFGNQGNNVNVFSIDTAAATYIFQRNIVKGGGAATERVAAKSGGTAILRNNVIYDCGEGSADTGGIHIDQNPLFDVYISNNTIIDCDPGIACEVNTGTPTIVAKNNLVQGSSTCFIQPGEISTSAKNVSEDATSPDTSYRSLNCHDGTSCFTNYASNDYSLVAGGDEISTLDDGDDLSGDFSDDVIDQARSTWYIGAFEIVAAGGATANPMLLMNHFGGGSING